MSKMARKKKPKSEKAASKAATSLTGFRLRIYPKPSQEKVLMQWVGSKRWVYNTCLHRISHEEEYARRKEFWMLGQIDPGSYGEKELYSFKQSPIDVSRDITDWRNGKPMGMLSSKDILDPNVVCQTAVWLSELPRTIITQTLRDLETALSRFKEGISEKPSYIQPSQTQSCRLQLDSRATLTKDGKSTPRSWVAYWGQNELFIPFLNEVVTFKNNSGLPQNLPKTITITKESTGHWYVSFAVTDVSPIWDKSLTLDQNCQPIVKGFDQNSALQNRLVDSDGKSFSRDSYIEKTASHIAHLQRTMAKQEKDSGRYNDNQRKLSKLHKKAKNKRKDFTEKTSTDVVKHTAVICVEELDNKGMIEQANIEKAKRKAEAKDKAEKAKAEKDNPKTPQTKMAQGFIKSKKSTPIERTFQKNKLAKALSDAAFGMMTTAIERKAKKHGREILYCGQFTATSPVCHQCGFRVEKSIFTLKVKKWTCPSCNMFHLRDHNSAINIKWEALAVRDQTARIFPQDNTLKTLSQIKQTEEFLRINPHIQSSIIFAADKLQPMRKHPKSHQCKRGRAESRTSRGGKLLFPAKRGMSLPLNNLDGTNY